jgi:hypothetical protein
MKNTGTRVEKRMLSLTVGGWTYRQARLRLRLSWAEVEVELVLVVGRPKL